MSVKPARDLSEAVLDLTELLSGPAGPPGPGFVIWDPPLYEDLGHAFIHITPVNDGGAVALQTLPFTTQTGGLAVNEIHAVSQSSAVPRGMVSSAFTNDLSSGLFVSTKARGTELAPADVQDGDHVGVWVSLPYVNGVYNNTAGILTQIDGVVLPGSIPTRMGFFTCNDGSVTRTENFSIEKNGDAKFQGHLIGNAGVPTATPGLGVGPTGTVTVDGTDTAGTVIATTDGGPSGSGAIIFTFNFATPYTSPPRSVVLNPANANAAQFQTGPPNYIFLDGPLTSVNSFVVKCGNNSLGNSREYRWTYIVVQ